MGGYLVSHLGVVQTLHAAGGATSALDPEGIEEAREVLNNVDYRDDAYGAMERTDGLAIVTERDVIRAVDRVLATSMLKQPMLVYLRSGYPHSLLEDTCLTLLGGWPVNGVA